ncbi:MAG: FmdB family transcriptional regulator [candidate division Zixibacteria bacterium SM23_73_2]|nr:MAG: FmdB family transcriptional regulator [candidate division Zixibacteria bacterium SM23_73_2]
MPTYEYLCQSCGFKFDAFQRMTDEPLEKCPQCKGELKRLISGGGGLIFKGAGFYATDYRSESYKKKEKEEKKSHSEVKGKDAVPKSKAESHK